MCMIMVILFMCKLMYYILLLSQMLKLQFCSESKFYAAILQLNSLPGKILFFKLQIGNFFWEIGKKGGYFGLGKGPIFGPW